MIVQNCLVSFIMTYDFKVDCLPKIRESNSKNAKAIDDYIIWRNNTSICKFALNRPNFEMEIYIRFQFMEELEVKFFIPFSMLISCYFQSKK